jgi:hypothetical protein
LVACISLYPDVCSAIYPCLVQCSGFYAGLHIAQSRSSATLASMEDLVVSGNAELDMLMDHTKMKSSHFPTATRT